MGTQRLAMTSNAPPRLDGGAWRGVGGVRLIPALPRAFGGLQLDQDGLAGPVLRDRARHGRVSGLLVEAGKTRLGDLGPRRPVLDEQERRESHDHQPPHGQVGRPALAAIPGHAPPPPQPAGTADKRPSRRCRAVSGASGFMAGSVPIGPVPH